MDRTVTDHVDTGLAALVQIGGSQDDELCQLTRPVVTASSATIAASARMRVMVSGIFWDVGLAVVVYYGIRALGVSDYLALLAGSIVSAARVVWVGVRSRKLDPFAGFLLLIFGVGLALTFATGDARFVLVKDSATSALAGLTFLGSCLARHPLTYYAAQRFAGPAGAAELRAKTETSPTMRRRWYMLSLVWGAGLLTEAFLRIPLAYLLPIDVAVGASTILMIVAYTLLISWTIYSAKHARS